MFQAGTSEAGYESRPPAIPDATYVKAPTLEAGQAFYAHVSKLPKYGRDDGDLPHHAGPDRRDRQRLAKDARDKFMRLVEDGDQARGRADLRAASSSAGSTFSGYDLDEAIPVLPHIEAAMTTARMRFDRNGRRMTVRSCSPISWMNLGHLDNPGALGEVADEPGAGATARC